jgi:hypothetical protein
MSNGLRREVHRHRPLLSYWLLVCMLAVWSCSAGCRWWKSDAPEPSHQLRSSFGGTPPSGLDSRARQIESNLGVR